MFYQLKAIRKNTKPPIWRRIFVPSNITFAQLAVVLETMLEIPVSDSYQFEFFGKKMGMIEWHEEDKWGKDRTLSYKNGPDTYINDWMEVKKAFTFKLRDRSLSHPEYLLEIENVIERIEMKVDGKYTEIQSPIIMEEASPQVDTYWTDVHKVNKILRTKYFIKTCIESKYQYCSEIREQIERGNGLYYCKKCANRDIHSTDPQKEREEEQRRLEKERLELEQRIAQLTKELDDLKNSIPEEKPKELKTNGFNRNSTLKEYLRQNTKEELLDIAKEEGISVIAKRKDQIVDQVAMGLMGEECISRRLLVLTEEDLDIFETVLEKGLYYPKNKKEEELLEELSYMFLVIFFKDNGVMIPDEVAAYYWAKQEEGEGYRVYHRKTNWLIKCVRAAHIIFATTPLKVLYRMYRQNPVSGSQYKEFLQLLNSIPKRLLQGVILEERIIVEETYRNGDYRIIEDQRKDDEFYCPKEDEIICLSKDCYPSYEDAYQKLFSCLCKKHGYSKEEAKDICMNAFSIFSGGGIPSHFFERYPHLTECYNTEQEVVQFFEVIVNVMNNTRRSALNGFKPKEKRQSSPLFGGTPVVPKVQKSGIPEKLQVEVTEGPLYGRPKKAPEKVYPNAPCPCGSGKKYKKCCGR